MALISIHYDGPITNDHRVSLRVMARTYEHIQRAIDRAYLIDIHGNVWKHARLRKNDYANVDFLAAYPREGGIILDCIKDNARPIIDRIASALIEPFERAVQGEVDEAAQLADEIQDRRQYVQGMQQNTIKFETLVENPPAEWANKYSDRAILKEIDQITHPISSEDLEGSIVEFSLQGSQLYPTYQFNSYIARNFHSIVARRELGPATIVRVNVRTLDKGNNFAKPKAKIVNLASNREVVLHLNSRADFEQLSPFHAQESVHIFACPFIESGGFDVNGGDLQFIGIANQLVHA